MNQFVMQGSFFAHRALTRDVKLLNSIAQRIGMLNRDQLGAVRKWYDFFWNMMEAHHAAEDDLLFRAVEERLEAPSEVIEVMEVEHNRLQFLIDEIKKHPQSVIPLSGTSALKSALSDISKVDHIKLSALMFQTGYLTIRGYNSEENSYQLGFPNREVKEAFFNSLIHA